VICFLGDDQARSLGIRVNAVRGALVILSVVIASVAVSLCGVIGFVGLVGPHIARLVIGSDHSFLFPLSVFTGGTLLVGADWVGRVVTPPVVIPVGITVSLIGAPVFIYLIFKQAKNAGA
jgi:iron complex transport system permease protein